MWTFVQANINNRPSYLLWLQSPRKHHDHAYSIEGKTKPQLQASSQGHATPLETLAFGVALWQSMLSARNIMQIRKREDTGLCPREVQRLLRRWALVTNTQVKCRITTVIGTKGGTRSWERIKWGNWPLPWDGEGFLEEGGWSWDRTKEQPQSGVGGWGEPCIGREGAGMNTPRWEGTRLVRGAERSSECVQCRR